MNENQGTIERSNPAAEKLVDNGTSVKPSLSLADWPPAKSTNKQLRRQIEPHIRHHKVKGRLYYYWCRAGKEVYLGTADSILAAVKL